MIRTACRPLRALVRRAGARQAWAGLALLLVLGGQEARAASPEPSDQAVILTVSGSAGGEARKASFTLAELERLGTSELVTTTPFTNAAVNFTGVTLRRIFEAVGVEGTVIHATALNDYTVDIPVADTTAYDVILATRIDGSPIPVRARGPLWVIYPWSRHAALAGPEFAARSIWQVRTIELR